MSVEFRIGDLFAQDVRALGHGVNCSGVMGAGVAAQFRRRWPSMYAVYRQACLTGALKPGGMQPWWTSRSKPAVVYNLASQDRPGPRARLDWLSSALQQMLVHAEDSYVASIAVPQVGSGIGGLRWEDVRDLMIETAEDSPVRLVVVSLPETVRL